MQTFEKVNYRGWQNCYRLSNGILELIITADVGPRIIRFGFVDQDNEFAEFEEMIGQTGGDEWKIYGGHRLWHAPEIPGRTYFPDNTPITVVQQGDCVHVEQPVEPTTGIKKEIDIYLASDAASVRVVHRLTNHNLWAVEFAPWALSVMATGGKIIIPLPPRGSHQENLLPTNSLTMWAYTNMSDPRWTWGEKYIMLRQDTGIASPQKIGVMVPDGWAAYARNDHLFVKTYSYVAGAAYPDWGCSVETFTNDLMLEVESLGPIAQVEPGEAVEHVENWYLFQNVPAPLNDADIDKNVLPKIQTVKSG